MIKVKDCLFCKIINKEIPSYTIYEDEKVKVFLDLNQDCPGHMLIIPKMHTLDLYSIDKSILNYMYDITLKMQKLLNEKMQNDGLTLLQNNGIAQDIKHFHLHLLPKYNKKPVLNIEEIFNILTK